MPTPQQTGRYLAKVRGVAVEQKESGSVQAVIDFDLTEFLGTSPATPMTGGEHIRGWFTLVNTNEKKNSLNEININALRDALGAFDGFSDLASGQFTGVECQVTIDDRPNPKDGKVYKNVKYIAHKDYSGPTAKGESEDTLRSLDLKFGSMIKALNGAKSKATLAKPTNGGTVGTDDTAQAKDLCWQEFRSKVKQHAAESPQDAYGQNEELKVFKDLMRDVHGNKASAEYTAKDWAALRQHVRDNFSPATRGTIPF